jgi:uncharacterized membrane protein YfcA
MSKREEASLALSMLGLFYITLGVWAAATDYNPWVAAGLIGLGVVQTVYFGVRYVRKRRTHV